jgi:hypothetical protein
VSDADRRSTRPGARRVLAVAHTVTSVARLLDVLPVFDGDPRTDVRFTRIPGSSFGAGVAPFIADVGGREIAWSEATRSHYDLALAAGNSGDLYRLNAPLLIIPHGLGYNKYLNRESRIANRESRAGLPVYGLAPEQLLRNGRVVPARIALSHDEQLLRLKELCPEAVPHAVIAGDPCFDRLSASLPWRERYRRSLGLSGGQRLVAVSSTWGGRSLLGRRLDLIARLLADLPADDYRVAAIVHPGVWYHHGPANVRSWLADCRRAGLLLMPPREGWRAAVVAADCVIGDHGSVTLYASAAGRPVLLAGFDEREIDPATAMAALGRRAPPLTRPYRESIETAIARGPLPGTAEEAIASPGRSARLLRDVMYELMGLDPIGEPRVLPAPAPVPQREAEVPALLAEVGGGAGRLRVGRYPAEVSASRSIRLADPHLVVDDTEPDARLRRMADVLVRRRDSPGLSADRPLAAMLDAHPGCLCAADVSPGRCAVRLHDGRDLAYAVDGLDPAIAASVAYHLLVSGAEPATDLAVETPGELGGRISPC